MARFLIRDFALANSAYIGGVVHFYGLDEDGEADEENLITLYEGLTGSGTLRNPQRLDGEGMNAAPIYADESCIGFVSGLAVADHRTGIISQVGVDATYAGAVMTPSGSDVANPAYPYAIIFATEVRNPSGVWDDGDPTKLTVPAGQTTGSLHGQIAWANIAVDAYVTATWYKNGVATPYKATSGKSAISNPVLQVSTPTLVLVPGDAWTLVANSDDAASDIDVSDTWGEMRLG